MHDSAAVRPKASPVAVPDGFSKRISDIITGKTSDDLSYLIPAEGHEIESCPFCGCLTSLCVLADGHEYFATVITGEGGKQQIDIVNPHLCRAALRHEDFLNSPPEPEFDFDSPQEAE